MVTSKFLLIQELIIICIYIQDNMPVGSWIYEFGAQKTSQSSRCTQFESLLCIYPKYMEIL